MATPHIYVDPTISIDGDDYVADSSSVSLVPANIMADFDSWGTPGVKVASGLATWTFSAKMKISYNATTGTWNQLNALWLTRTVKTVILKPNDAVVGATNPFATFSIYPPAVTFMEASGPGQTGMLTLEAMAVGSPVFTVI